MVDRIFLSYATGDEPFAKELYDSLIKLKDIVVCNPKWNQNRDVDYTLAVKEGLDACKTIIIIITFNSTNTIWLNQEIGYAVAKKIPMILIIEQGIDVQGFLKGKEYFIFNRGDFSHNIDQVIRKLRSILN